MFKRKFNKRMIRNPKLDYSKFYNDITAFVNDNSIKSESNYIIITSTKERVTYIFEYENNIWKLLYTWSCTVGKPSTPSPNGIFKVGAKYKAIGDDEVAVRYAVNIFEDYYYHSILYDSTDQYIKDDRLGVAISHGCIRLETKNANWIFDNIPESSTIIIK